MRFKFLAIFFSFLISLWFFFQIPRVEFLFSFILYTLLFGLYILISIWAIKLGLNIWQILLMALLTRLMFIGIPMHSDDYFRFFWDGQLILHQINPYGFTPKELIDMDLIPYFLKPIYVNINSQDYFSVYPVTNQSVFAFAAWAGGESLYNFIIWVRVILVIFEILGIWILYRLLRHLKKNPTHAILYALNPLVLLEITGNLHFEGIMVIFIFLGILALLHCDAIKAGIYIGMAISVKLTPLILLPIILKYLSWRKFLWFITAMSLICTLFFLSILLSGTFVKFFTSIQLYYGTFEFNASIYYVLRELGYLIKGYNMIASISISLSLLVFTCICYLSYKAKINHFQHLIFFLVAVYFIYLILSMVIHPWYIIPLIGIGVLGNYKYPLLWSYLIYLSYYAYGVDPYKESYLLIGIQYGLLYIFAITEYTQYLSSIKNKDINVYEIN